MQKDIPLTRGHILPVTDLGKVTRSQIVRYQGASGDFDAAHYDDAHAQSFGYPGVFSLGMLHAGQMAVAIADVFGPEKMRFFKVRFRGVIFPGDQLTCSGTISEIDPEHPDQVVIDLTVSNQDQKPVLLGVARFAK